MNILIYNSNYYLKIWKKVEEKGLLSYEYLLKDYRRTYQIKWINTLNGHIS